MKREFAPAKVNLTLHVTGQDPNGYHLLDSLVVFASIGDWVTGRLSPDLRLTVSGPHGTNDLAGPDNLVLRAAQLFGQPLDLHLEKNLPIASGIGGGSADAAATLKVAADILDMPVPGLDGQLSLGADIPVCVAGPTAQRMRGIGEIIDPIHIPKGLGIILINPGEKVSTPACFAGLGSKNNAPMRVPEQGFGTIDGFFAWLADQRNDLETPARQLSPAIDQVLSSLNLANARVARMSGSGATFFGLFATPQEAHTAAQQIENRHPEWWVKSGGILD